MPQRGRRILVPGGRRGILPGGKAALWNKAGKCVKCCTPTDCDLLMCFGSHSVHEYYDPQDTDPFPIERDPAVNVWWMSWSPTSIEYVAQVYVAMDGAAVTVTVEWWQWDNPDFLPAPGTNPEVTDTVNTTLPGGTGGACYDDVIELSLTGPEAKEFIIRLIPVARNSEASVWKGNWTYKTAAGTTGEVFHDVGNNRMTFSTTDADDLDWESVWDNLHMQPPSAGQGTIISAGGETWTVASISEHSATQGVFELEPHTNTLTADQLYEFSFSHPEDTVPNNCPCAGAPGMMFGTMSDTDYLLPFDENEWRQQWHDNPPPGNELAADTLTLNTTSGHWGFHTVGLGGATPSGASNLTGPYTISAGAMNAWNQREPAGLVAGFDADKLTLNLRATIRRGPVVNGRRADNKLHFRIRKVGGTDEGPIPPADEILWMEFDLTGMTAPGPFDPYVDTLKYRFGDENETFEWGEFVPPITTWAVDQYYDMTSTVVWENVYDDPGNAPFGGYRHRVTWTTDMQRDDTGQGGVLHVFPTIQGEFNSDYMQGPAMDLCWLYLVNLEHATFGNEPAREIATIEWGFVFE